MDPISPALDNNIKGGFLVIIYFSGGFMMLTDDTKPQIPFTEACQLGQNNKTLYLWYFITDIRKYDTTFFDRF